MQLNQTTGMPGLTTEQLIIGPFTDNHGGKAPVWCLLVFVLSAHILFVIFLLRPFSSHIEHLSAIFRGKDYVVFAVPFRMR